MAQATKYPRRTSKPIILTWACLNKEEEYKGKSTGKYSVRGTFATIEDTNELLADLEGLYDTYKKTNKDLSELKPKRNSVPSFGESENVKTGEIGFKFSTSSTWKKDGSPKIVPVVDAKGKPYKGPIGNGSIGRICFTVAPKCVASDNYGVSLWLEAVQVLELKEYNAGDVDAAVFGFGVEEGFNASEEVEGNEENPFDNPSESQGEAVKDAGDF